MIFPILYFLKMNLIPLFVNYLVIIMNLNAYTREDKTESFLFLFIKNIGAVIQQTQTKAQETLELILRKSREYFSFDMP